MKEEAEVAAIRVKAEGGDAVAMRRLGISYRDRTRGLKQTIPWPSCGSSERRT